MEVLAPAGSIDMLKTTVRHGADAVYLGVQSFSARAKSLDFTLDNLAEHVAYAHKFGTKVYLTLNTLVSDAEMPSAMNVASTAYQIGVDGVLVQDMGLANQIRIALPKLPLHASTQMGIHNLAGAKYVERKGFNRVVLARETPLLDIIDIKRNTGLEVEVFVHGALCVSFSGNCYYSSLVAVNSGNRGRCLQLCRKCYHGNCGSGNITAFLLSPADLNLSDRLADLERAGVDSIKIEGRMKRVEYAGAVVDAYKKALAGQLLSTEDKNGLLTIFNRGGFTQGYLNGMSSAQNFVGAGLQNHMGLPIGQVAAVTQNSLTIQSNRVLSNADGFKVIRNEEEVAGASHAKLLEGSFYRLSKIGDVKIGDKVCITTDAQQLASINSVRRKIPLSVKVNIRIGEYAHIRVSAQGHVVEVVGQNSLPAATNAPLTPEDIRFAFGRILDTDYTLSTIEIETNGVFLSKGELNALRRESISKLDNSFEISHEVEKTPIVPKAFITVKNAGILHYYVCHSIEDLMNYNNIIKQDEMLIYSPENYAHLCKGNANTYLQLPTIVFQADMAILKEQEDVIKTYRGLVAENAYAMELATSFGLSVIAGFGLNVANHFIAESFDDVFFSIENLADNNLVAFGLGEYPLMTLAHCPYKVVTGHDCRTCAYDGTLTYTDNSEKTLSVRRVQLARCYFSLTDKLEIPVEERSRRLVIDTRGLSQQEIEFFLSGKTKLVKKNYFARELK